MRTWLRKDTQLSDQFEPAHKAALERLERAGRVIDGLSDNSREAQIKAASDEFHAARDQASASPSFASASKGIFSVTGINAVTYTAATPAASGLLPKLYDAIQQIATNRKRQADTIVMHPRRAAWMASNLSSTVPLFQLGNLMQAAGEQAGGFTVTLGGLNVVLDPNLPTNGGAGTNEDAIAVVRASDIYFWEGPLQPRVYPDVLSATLQCRLQVYAYSALGSERFPKAISKISGTGCSAPVF